MINWDYMTAGVIEGVLGVVMILLSFGFPKDLTSARKVIFISSCILYCIVLSVLVAVLAYRLAVQIALTIGIILLSLNYTYPFIDRAHKVFKIILISLICEVIVGAIVYLINGYNMQESFSSVLFAIITILLSKLLAIAIVIISIYMSKDGKAGSRLSIVTNILLTMLGIVFVGVGVWSSVNSGGEEWLVISIVASLLIFVIDIMVIAARSNSSKFFKKTINFEVEKKEYQEQIMYFEQLIEQKNHYNKKIHDVKNMLIVLKERFDLDNLDFPQELNELVNISKDNNLIYSKNKVINCMLSTKNADCNKNNIILQHDIIVDNNIKVEDIDIAVILGNLLDNAMNECLRIGEKLIEITIKQSDHFLSIMVVNKTNISEIIETNRSYKKYLYKRGFGLSNIKEIARKYNGTYSFDIKNGNFVAVVMLQLI